MGIEKSIKSAALTMSGLMPFKANTPTQYGDKQFEYFASESKTFIEKKARYASDFVLAQVQGLNLSDPGAWENYYIRMTDVVRPSASITRRFDDYKAVLFADRTIQYIPPGTKIVTMGSTWLATNPANISGGDGSSVVQRCNTTWNHLDYYGNVLQEPIVVETHRANASDSDAQNSMYITKGYFNVACQYNEQTAQLDTNSRMILGKGAYRVTGYADFSQEFTGDYSSRRLLEFAIRYVEPNAALDDMENHVAEGKSFSWTINLNGAPLLTVGETAQFTATSTRKGADVSSTEEYPISYTWASSDESVATVDESGNVTALSAGSVTITATLTQNTGISSAFEMTVENPGTETGVKFISAIPASLSAFDDIIVSAAFFDAGQETSEELVFTLSGADDGSYGYLTGPRAVTIYGYGYSKTPLTVTAQYGEYSASAEIRLEGF